MIQASDRLSNYNYVIRDIAGAAEALEREGQKIIHLNLGDPQAFGFRPPESVTEEVQRALQDGFTGYANSAGLRDARACIAEYATNLGSPTTIDDVIIKAGASEAADLILTAFLNPGDAVLVPSPGYPLYSALLHKLGAEPRPYALDATNRWQPDVEEIASLIDPEVKAIVLINPNNPTGAVTDDTTTREILEIADALNILVISDEVYRELCFAPRPMPSSVIADKIGTPLVTFESLSKTHMLSGWRIGWMRFSNSERMPELRAAVTRLASGRLCSPTPPQYAVRPALESCGRYRHEFCVELLTRRDFAVKRINEIEGLSCGAPDSAFYLMVKVEVGRLISDEQFVHEMLKSTGVLVVPGSAFGCDKKAGYFRMVFLADRQVLADAIERISHFLNPLLITTE